MKIRRSLLLLLCIFLASCQGQQQHGKTQLTFWAMGADGEYIKELLPAFNKVHPDIDVTVQMIPWGAAHEKLLTAFAGQSTPDICQLGNTWIPEFEAIGALVSLDTLIERSQIVKASAHFDGIWQTNSINDHIYGIPWYVDTRVLFYRKDVLARAGFTDPPQSWIAWLDMARKIKLNVIGQENKYAIHFSLIFNDGYVPLILIMENNGTFLKDNYCYGAFDDPATLEALRFYLTFFREGLASHSVTEFSNIYQAFANADFSMMIHGPWVANELRKRTPELAAQWGTAPMPLKKNRASLAGGASLVIFKESKASEAAWKLIEFLSQVETQVAYFRLTRNLPAIKDAWQVPELQADPKIAAFYHQLENVYPTPPIAEWEQIYVKLQQHLELVIHGRLTLEEAMQQLNREVDRILEKRRWLMAKGLL